MKEKIARYERKFKKSVKYILTLWFPAIILFVFMGILAVFVLTSKDGSFRGCGAQLFVCMGDEVKADLSARKMMRLTACAYQTVWCEARIVWGKMTGDEYLPPDFKAPAPLPPIDEKAEKELFDKLTKEDWLDEQFKQFEDLPPADVFPDDVRALMNQAREERLQLEKDMEEQNRRILEQLENNAGQDASESL